ncbi:MAG TPA: tyrosine-type recombinase/integrase [Paludibacteraceae bacterium]|nr:tyrosine-type recombinase/integrase [Paludibacteraceae bacterium]
MKTEKTINQLITEFVSEKDVREQTRKQYQTNLNQWFRWLNLQKIDVRNPRRADAIAFKDYLNKTKSTYTIASYVTVLKLFYKWLEDQGIYENIASTVKFPKRSDQHTKGYLKQDQVIDMLAAMPLRTISDFRNYAIVNLMLRTGMRRCEVVRMNVEDLIISNDVYQLHIQRKGRLSKDQTITLDKAIVDPIREYLSLRAPFADSSPVFINHSRFNINQRINEDYISRLAKESMRRIGIERKDMTCHSFRHTAAITAIKAKALPYEVQQMLGHRSGSTTEIYFKAAEAETMSNNPAISAIALSYQKQTKTVQKQAVSL